MDSASLSSELRRALKTTRKPSKAFKSSQESIHPPLRTRAAAPGLPHIALERAPQHRRPSPRIPQVHVRLPLAQQPQQLRLATPRRPHRGRHVAPGALAHGLPAAHERLLGALQHTSERWAAVTPRGTRPPPPPSKPCRASGQAP